MKFLDLDGLSHFWSSIKERLSPIITGTIVGWEGDEIPEGYEEVSDPANTYSLEEQVVGTYLGKPLYKRTYTSYKLQTASDGIEYYIFDTDLTKEIKFEEGTIYILFQSNIFEQKVGAGGVDFGPTEFTKNGGSGALYVTRKVIESAYSTQGLEVTIWYTKTTD